MHRKRLFLFVLCFILAATPAAAAKEVKVPEPLKPWVDWVLWEHKELACPVSYQGEERRIAVIRWVEIHHHGRACLGPVRKKQ